MNSPSLSNDRLNFQCVTVASVDFIKLPLIDIMTNNITPVDLYRKISSCKNLKQGNSKLSPDQRLICYISPPGIPDYSRFDVTLLYKLIRHLCSLPSPTQGWGNPPQTTDTRISDDIERLRMFRNNYYAHAKSAAISDSVFRDIWRNLNDVITRIQPKIHGSMDYQKELLDIKSSKYTAKHYEDCKFLLEALLKLQSDGTDEAGFSIKGEDKVICGGITQIEAEVKGIETACRAITWQKRKGKDFEDINTQDEKYTGSTNKILVIQSVCKEDEGDYRAVLSLASNENDHEKSRNTIRLTVLGDLPCLNDLNVTTGDKGVNIHYNYAVLQLSPKVKGIKWRKDGKLLDMKSQKYVGGSVKEGCFTITSPTKEDTGTYSCTLISAVGSVSKDVTIGFPSAQISVQHKNIHVGSEIKIVSHDLSNPSADKFEWQKSKDGKDFDFIDITKPKYFGSSHTSKHPVLVIPKATFEDKLYYRLVLWNKFGEDVSNTVDINITGSVPNISTTQYTNIDEKSLKLIGNVFLYCGSPPIKEVYWTKNGDSIDIQGSGGRLSTDNYDLIIKNVGQDDAGDYRLTATNSVGSKTSEFIVVGLPRVFMDRAENKGNGSLLFKARIEAIPTPYHIQWNKRGTSDKNFTPVDVNAEEYKGTTSSLPDPVLVLNNTNELENNSYQITVTNFVGSTVLLELEKGGFLSKEDLPKDRSTMYMYAQFVVSCVLCANNAVYHCEQCGLRLCWECRTKHLAEKHSEDTDKYGKPFTECNSHLKGMCQLFCKDCIIPICQICVTGAHKKHDIVLLEDVLKEKKEHVFEEIHELETTLLPELQKHKSCVDQKKYKHTIHEISVHEESICKAVREVGTNLKSLVLKQMEENLKKTEQNALKEKTILQIIQETKQLLERNDFDEILQFKDIRCQVNISPLIIEENTPVFQGKILQEGIIQSLFGSLVDYTDKNTEIGYNNLIKQTWFHGFIPKKEARELVGRNGDFLVWEMTNHTEDRYVISYFHDRAFDFKVTTEYIVGKVGQNTTLVDLINYLVSSGQPLSNDNPSTLKFPVDRKQHQLERCQITLGSKIENVTKGDMLFGTFGTHDVLVCIDNDCEIRLFNNINLSRILVHKNIVNIEGYSALQKPILLVLENMAGGSLLTYLRTTKNSVSTKKRIEMCYDVSKGLKYLHRQKFIHSDVAARNCLVTGGGTVKIYDFWMTRKGEEYQLQQDQKMQLQIKWTAPETLKSGKLTLLSDVWGFGILMWEIFSSGKCPYPQFTDVETKEKVSKGYRMEFPENTPKYCCNLMRNCWEVNSARRHHFKDIVKKFETLIKTQK